MKFILKFMLITVIFMAALNAAQARGGTHTFTQPDGTKFEGVLKGDSSFHWIESNSKVVMYNKKDKYYYNATLNANKKLELTKEKPVTKLKTDSSQVAASSTVSQEKKHTVNSAIREALRALQKESRKGHHPR